MIRIRPAALLIAAPLFLLAGCAEEAPPVLKEVSRPVKTLVIEAPDAGGVRSFPARIDANRKVELAFRVAGKVAELPVKESDRVQEGGLIAKLDPKDFQIVVNDRQATFDNTQKNFSRAKELVGKGHISKMDYDRIEAEYKSAQAALDAARQDIAYTELKAPFAGMIARRYVQRFEEVQAKQAVVALHDVETLEVKVDVPESIIRSLSAAGETVQERRDRIQVFAQFENLPGSRIPLTFKEAATKADPKTQTFEVTYAMPRQDNANILPGMTATVIVDLSRYMGADSAVTVPAAAVVGDVALEPRVWVVDPQTMTVAPRPVTVGRMAGDGIEVTGGLDAGDRIVIAGVPFLVEGMKVTLMATPEQAERRPGEAGQ